MATGAAPQTDGFPPRRYRRVRRWALASATLAPILLIGGWTLAAIKQPVGFDSARDTISALAGYGATDRWIMTIALLLLGICHVTTASGLSEAARPGRVVLAVGGVATIGVGLAPLPATGSSTIHGVFASIAFFCLAFWALTSWRRATTTSWGLRKVPAISAGTILLALVAVFVGAQWDGNLVGLTERVAAGAQALWPMVVVWFAYAKDKLS